MVNGKRIRELREAAGMTTRELAVAVYTSQTMIVHIETGVKSPSVGLLQRVADYFGLTVDDLLSAAECVS